MAGCRRFADSGVSTHVAISRAVTVTTVPLLVKEQQSIFPFLRSDFAKGGLLEGMEVYGFSPSTIVSYAGDTLQFTFVNPEDDPHTFVIDAPEARLAVAIQPQHVANATLVTRTPGIFIFRCTYPNHSRSMWGQLVVLNAEER